MNQIQIFFLNFLLFWFFLSSDFYSFLPFNHSLSSFFHVSFPNLIIIEGCLTFPIFSVHILIWFYCIHFQFSFILFFFFSSFFFTVHSYFFIYFHYFNFYFILYFSLYVLIIFHSLLLFNYLCLFVLILFLYLRTLFVCLFLSFFLWPIPILSRFDKFFLSFCLSFFDQFLCYSFSIISFFFLSFFLSWTSSDIITF